MKKKILIIIFLGGVTVIVLLLILAKVIPPFIEQHQPHSTNAAVKAMSSVLLIERDVPQTRIGFEPIVNHEALVVNLSNKAIEVDIESPIPKGFYIVKKFYPVFGRDSLLSMPMQFPKQVAISAYKLLDRPVIDTKKGETVFCWRKIYIPAKQAIIAQYDNYFGSRSQFYTKDGLKILELDIRTTFEASSIDGGKGVVFELYYDLKNQGKDEIKDILMDVILPDSVYADAKITPVQLLEVTDAVASPKIKIMRGMLGDGFGNGAVGTIFTVNIQSLKPGKSQNIWMKVIGKNIAKKGDSYPLLTFQYRMKGDPIWPPTLLKSRKKLEVTRFSYLYVNLILPDRRLFRFEPDGVKIIQMNGLQ